MPDSNHPASDPELAEILEALDMPTSALKSWFGQVRTFCDEHGGRRHYRELLELMDACQEHLE